ncbi:condensation domain-containing protein [Allorhizocola rhizosphaerae]|uniref:condensation domain-containing protein n=1 Tax=Allorhizocola rhizosphaerae TaxID=1872709 RepID=UPI001FE68CCA|nr:condensation domain-containing protein [Allorhizocola rhizosphaerae]
MVAAFRGERATIAPLTWGQQGIWKLVSAMAPNDAFLNLCRIVPVPQRAAGSVESVAAAFGELISRHEALRTRVQDVDGEPCQVVADAGECPLELIESTAEEAEADAERAMERLRRLPFDYVAELPIRVALVVADARVRFAVLVLSHVAVDWYAYTRLERDLRVLLLRGAITTPAGRQPADLAREEQGDAGRERTARAHDHWSVQYGRFPAQVLTEIAPPAAPRYQWAELTSRALDLACRAVAAQHAVSTSTVLLAATGVLLGAHTGHDVCGMLTIVNNRFREGLDEVMAPTNQLGVVTLDLRGATTFGGLVSAVWPEVLQSMRNAYYDQHTLDRFLAEGGHVHGEKIEPFCCFNDMHTAGNSGQGEAVTEEQLREALKATELTFTEKLNEFNWHFMLAVNDAPGALNLTLTTDSARMPLDRQRQFLYGIENLVVRAATGEVRLDELAGRVS